MFVSGAEPINERLHSTIRCRMHGLTENCWCVCVCTGFNVLKTVLARSNTPLCVWCSAQYVRWCQAFHARSTAGASKFLGDARNFSFKSTLGDRLRPRTATLIVSPAAMCFIYNNWWNNLSFAAALQSFLMEMWVCVCACVRRAIVSH